MSSKHIVGALALILSFCTISAAVLIADDAVEQSSDIVLSDMSVDIAKDGWQSEYHIEPGEKISIRIAPEGLGSRIYYVVPAWLNPVYNNPIAEYATELELVGSTMQEGRYDVHVSYKQLQFNSGMQFSIVVGSSSSSPSVTYYTISFNSSGGSEVSSQSVSSGSPISKPADPVKAGYSFVGWRGPSGALYDFDSPVVQSFTLTAVWEANNHTVTFNSNGGTEVSSQNVADGSKIIKPADPEKEGYTFSGWYTDEFFNNSYNFNAYVTADLTLYAKWEAVQTVYHTVFFNSNGGSFDDGSDLREVTQIAGTKFMVPTSISKPGYTLASYSNPHGALQTGREYDIDALSGHVFYADWVPINYTVSYVTLGGTAIADQTVPFGEKLTKPADPAKDGFAFAGWYTDAALTAEYDFNTEINENITLYAKWTAAEDTGSSNHNVLLFWISLAVIIVIAAGLFSGGRRK